MREHTHRMEQLQTSSHMLKHALEQHGEEEDLRRIRFGVKGVYLRDKSWKQEQRNYNILN